MAIKIAVIAYACRRGGGLFQTINLLKALKNVTEDEQFMIVCPAGCGYEEIELPANSKLFVYKGSHSPLRYWFELHTLPKIVRNYKPDVIFGPANVGLTNPPVPQALFMRNAYFFYDKKHYPDMNLRTRLRIASLRPQIRKCVSVTDLIFCQTPVVKRRFCEKYHYPEGQIRILGFPPPKEITPITGSEAPSVFDRSSDNFYILLLTPYIPHRNPGVLIPLCRRYGVQIRQKQIKFITTVQVKDHPRAGAFLKEISRQHLEDVIINVGPLSRKDVARYLCCSDLLWLPTLLECLPTSYLEAMSVGVPILAPNLDFANYVCGDAAVYYNPWDVDSMFEKIMLLRENQEISQTLMSKGKLQLQDSKKFPQSWEEVAATTLRELRKLAGK